MIFPQPTAGWELPFDVTTRVHGYRGSPSEYRPTVNSPYFEGHRASQQTAKHSLGIHTDGRLGQPIRMRAGAVGETSPRSTWDHRDTPDRSARSRHNERQLFFRRAGFGQSRSTTSWCRTKEKKRGQVVGDSINVDTLNCNASKRCRELGNGKESASWVPPDGWWTRHCVRACRRRSS